MVADQTALAPVAQDTEGPVPALAEEDEPTPYITVSLNGVVMRYQAGMLRPMLGHGLMAIDAMLRGEGEIPLDGKTKAMVIVVKQAVGLMLPMLGPMVAAVRAQPLVPESIKRMLPPVPHIPRHTDRVMFLLAYLAEVLHAALTANAFALDIEPDETAAEADAFRVRSFTLVDPAELAADEEE